MKILLADDHLLFRDALTQFIKALRPAWSITMSDSFNSAYQILESEDVFDIVLLDLRMPGMNGLDGLEKICENYPKQGCAILSGVAEEHHVKEALRLGAKAYFPKTLSGKALVKAIELVVATDQRFIPMSEDGSKIMPAYFDDHGEYSAAISSKPTDPEIEKLKQDIIESLTKREKEVLHYLAQGLSNKEICREMDIQVATVKLHVSGVCKKLNVDNRTQAAITAHQYGLISEFHSKDKTR